MQAENPKTKVLALNGDLVDPNFQKKLIDKTLSTFKKLDILVSYKISVPTFVGQQRRRRLTRTRESSRRGP